MDGIEDMALSTDISLFGNASGFFDILLKNNQGKYEKYDSLFLHPEALAIEKKHKSIRIWICLRGGGGVGKLGYHKLEANGLSEFEGITIHPGDSGTKMGNAIYKAVIENSHVKLRVEKSKTEDGVVKWKKF